MKLPDNLDDRIKKSVKAFWKLRTDSAAVRGGKQLDELSNLLADIVVLNGIPRECVFEQTSAVLPGYYRGTKRWDLLVIHNKTLVAAIELKSHVGSFGNNFNNRTEEAMGSAMDLWAAYKYDAYTQAVQPWLGYLMLLEDSDKVHTAVKNQEPHFSVLPEFVDASYARRYELFCEKLVREKQYNNAALILSKSSASRTGNYRCLNDALHIKTFLTSFAAHIEAYSTSFIK